MHTNRRTGSSLTLMTAALVLVAALTAAPAWSHCQVPCGIYDDAARVAALKEDARTIAKAVSEMTSLAGKSDPQSINQATRWVVTKEAHASHIIEVMANYFLAQRVKPGDDRPAYLSSLADHHGVITAAMKAKQKADTATVDALNAAIDLMAKHYAAHEH